VGTFFRNVARLMNEHLDMKVVKQYAVEEMTESNLVDSATNVLSSMLDMAASVRDMDFGGLKRVN